VGAPVRVAGAILVVSPALDASAGEVFDRGTGGFLGGYDVAA
jgi:hypothetical protein